MYKLLQGIFNRIATIILDKWKNLIKTLSYTTHTYALIRGACADAIVVFIYRGDSIFMRALKGSRGSDYFFDAHKRRGGTP